jgi:hypothetical protein
MVSLNLESALSDFSFMSFKVFVRRAMSFCIRHAIVTFTSKRQLPSNSRRFAPQVTRPGSGG